MVAATCYGITLPSSGSVLSAFWEMLTWGAVDRILWMGVLCLVTRCAPRTGDAIYTAVVVARSIVPNRPNCEFRVLLWRFAATAWKRAKTSPLTLVGIDLAASSWQRPVSHFRPHPAVSGEIRNGCHPPPTVLPWFGTPWFFLISKKWNWSWKDAGNIPLRISRSNRRECLTLWQKAFQKWRRRWDRCLHAGGNYFEGDNGR
jgi:hypothetical protein